MSNVIKFPESAIENVSHLSTAVLVRLFNSWNGSECDKSGTESVKGYSIAAIQTELNKRGEGKKIAV